ncbi:hypothetical protein ACFRCQ_20570 [Cytobacillus firmus]|uniref:Uncharacterized protein n=1 Tax=Cytobacillus oceanisediminis TaxID=665099 RepID=A0ABX3CKZ8_9BACI|nr:hypothetical protein [Cytobacillus oceanisediminis]OHX41363.1 hypothetical protein BBV17_28615 [Cytobacillus oceanisediminis]
MKALYFLIGICFIAFGLTISQIKYFILDTTYEKVNYSLKHAVHDGALQIDNEKVADGIIEFDKAVALETIHLTLSKNLLLNQDLSPKEGSYITDPLKIVETVYIDYNFIDTDTGLPVTFPFTYKYSNPLLNIDIERPIFGPSIVCVIEAKVRFDDEYQRYVTIQEYKY